MRRFVRKAVRAAVAGVCLLSLLACVGAIWLWWRSYRAGNSVYGRRDWTSADAAGDWHADGRSAAVGSGRGGLSLTVRAIHSRLPGPGYARPPTREWWVTGDTPDPAYGEQPPDHPPRQTAGFLAYADIQPGDRMRIWWVPYHLPAVVAAVPPLGWAGAYGRRARVRRRRARLGLTSTNSVESCLRCGYDLRGSPSGVCPECGTAAVLARQSRGAQ